LGVPLVAPAVDLSILARRPGRRPQAKTDTSLAEGWFRWGSSTDSWTNDQALACLDLLIIVVGGGDVSRAMRRRQRLANYDPSTCTIVGLGSTGHFLPPLLDSARSWNHPDPCVAAAGSRRQHHHTASTLLRTSERAFGRPGCACAVQICQRGHPPRTVRLRSAVPEQPTCLAEWTASENCGAWLCGAGSGFCPQ
jgi:hypothetical protein